MHDGVDTIVRENPLGTASAVSPARLDDELRSAVLPLLTARLELLESARTHDERADALARLWRHAGSPAIADRGPDDPRLAVDPLGIAPGGADGVTDGREAVDACFSRIAALENELAATRRSGHRSRR